MIFREELADYHHMKSEGCCLICRNSHEGCLCFECKCKQCKWYIDPSQWDLKKGKCQLVLIWAERKKNGQHMECGCKLDSFVTETHDYAGGGSSKKTLVCTCPDCKKILFSKILETKDFKHVQKEKKIKKDQKRLIKGDTKYKR